MLPRLNLDGFLLALIGAIALAALFPSLGADGGVLPISPLATYGVSVVFFLYGLTLAPEKLKAGAKRWQVHTLTQLATFALFPLVVVAAGWWMKSYFPEPIWLGFLYLAALPSTVSSSVAMTSLARGNVPLSVFNATLSSLLGVFVTPILMAFFVAASGEAMALGPVILKVVLLVLLPIVLGQIARRWLKDWAVRHASKIKFVDRGVILLIVFNSFSNSMVQGIWSDQQPWVIVEMVVAVLVLFAFIYGLVRLICGAIRLPVDERIACLFCASTKSLATGIPLAGVIFGDVPYIGLIITPLMIYHLAQLIIVTVIANRYAVQPAGR